MHKIVIAIIIIFNSCILVADVDPWDGYVLAVGKPTLVKFHSEYVPKGGEITMDAWIKMEFEELEAIKGDLPEQDKYTFIVLTHAPTKDEMYLLLDVSGELPKALYWTRPLPIVCFPNELLNKSIVAESFTNNWGRMGELCTYAD
jgi:hypothetical protein